MVFEQELDLLIRSSYPLIYIPTPEEERVEQLIGVVAEQGTPPRTVYKWDIIGAFQGALGGNPGNPISALNEIEKARPDVPAVFILRDFHRFLDDIQVSRKLRNLSRHLRNSRKTVIMLAPSMRIPADLAEEITVIDLSRPTYEEIDQELALVLEQ